MSYHVVSLVLVMQRCRTDGFYRVSFGFYGVSYDRFETVPRCVVCHTAFRFPSLSTGDENS